MLYLQPYTYITHIHRLVSLNLDKSKIKRISYKTKGGAEVCLPTYAFKVKLKDCDVELKFLVVLGKWNEEDDKKYHILITNQLELSSK